MRKILNKNCIGCPICQNPEISAVVDPLIFSCSSTRKEMLMNLENQGIYLDDDVFKDHMSHIFSIDEKEESNIMSLLHTPVGASNLDIVKRTLEQIESALTNMLLSGEQKSKEYNEMIKRKQEWLVLKAKLEGELNEGITVTLPDWIVKKQQNITMDAEIVQNLLPESV